MKFKFGQIVDIDNKFYPNLKCIVINYDKGKYFVRLILLKSKYPDKEERWFKETELK